VTQTASARAAPTPLRRGVHQAAGSSGGSALASGSSHPAKPTSLSLTDDAPPISHGFNDEIRVGVRLHVLRREPQRTG
jgi:hypothetical protein